MTASATVQQQENGSDIKADAAKQKPSVYDQVVEGEEWRRNLRGVDGYVSGPDGERPAWWWTGRQPVAGTPGMQPDGTMTSLPLPNLATVTRQEAIDYFDNTWTLTEVLFSALQGEEAYYRPPQHNLRHPFVFYYGHPAALYVNKLRVAGVLDGPVNAYFERIFETGVDEMSWDDLSKNDMMWPSLREVTEYRRTVYQLVKSHLERHPDFDALPIGWGSQGWAFFMGFEHERIHLETSSVLMRELPLRLLRKPPQWPAYHPSVTNWQQQQDGQQDGQLVIKGNGVANGHAANGANGVANGHAANGTANGHAANGHAANGHAGNGVANGHAGNGTNGHAANGHAANGVANGHTANGASLNGHAANGHSSSSTVTSTTTSTTTSSGITATSHRMIRVPAGEATLGKPSDWPSYGWDNEYGCRAFHVREFSASSCLVSNGEFLEFVRAGGYRTERWWRVEGWKWRTFRNAKWPTFWRPDGPAGLHRYKLRLIFEEMDLAPGLPAVVNRHEASAYCAWLSESHGLERGGHQAYRLLTEPEHHRLREVLSRDAEGRAAEDHVMQASGVQMRVRFNANLAYGSECAVDAMRPTALGFHDVFGNLWQWCEDHLAALPGSNGVHVYYDDFSTPCYDGEHSVIMGGSFISTGDEASAFARFHFRPHFFQHAGFRIVSGTGPKETSCTDSPGPHAGGWDPSTRRGGDSGSASGDRETALQRAVMAHYGGGHQAQSLAGPAAGVVPQAWASFPAAAVSLLADVAERLGVKVETALDIGCSVGGISFALAERCEAARVTGVDADAAAIAAAHTMQKEGRLEVVRKDDGVQASIVQVALPSGVASSSSARVRVSFRQMDPCCLAPDLPEHDVVMCVNLLERIVSPKGPLSRLGGERPLLRQGGLLLLGCTHQWSPDVADPQLWLTGTGPAGEQQPPDQAMRTALGPGFELVAESDLPLLLRGNSRRYELLLSHATVWRRVG